MADLNKLKFWCVVKQDEKKKVKRVVRIDLQNKAVTLQMRRYDRPCDNGQETFGFKEVELVKMA